MPENPEQTSPRPTSKKKLTTELRARAEKARVVSPWGSNQLVADALITDYGFTWGPLTVTRMAELPDGRVCLRVATDHRTLNIYATEAGRSLRVFSRGDELEPAPSTSKEGE